MALSQMDQIVALARALAKNPVPTAEVPAKLRPVVNALAAAWTAMTKAEKKNHRRASRDALVAAMPEWAKAQVQASIDEDIANDAEVN